MVVDRSLAVRSSTSRRNSTVILRTTLRRGDAATEISFRDFGARNPGYPEIDRGQFFTDVFAVSAELIDRNSKHIATADSMTLRSALREMRGVSRFPQVTAQIDLPGSPQNHVSVGRSDHCRHGLPA